MSIVIQTREYRLPEPIAERVRLGFFLHRGHFMQHVRDHFARPDEPWEAPLGKRAAEMCRQIIDRPDVSVVEEVYDRVVQVLDDGIDGSVGRPVFIAFVQRLEGRGGVREGYCFLAAQGFYVVAHGDFVRTALFVSDAASDSPATRFRKAWFNLKQKFAGRSYSDDKAGEVVRNERTIWVSQGNWESCPVGPERIAGAGPMGRLHERLGRELGTGGKGHDRPGN
jgi:hypothetical protein